jgi:hypothetical protein
MTKTEVAKLLRDRAAELERVPRVRQQELAAQFAANEFRALANEVEES